LVVADKASDLKAGVEVARDSIDSGRAMNAIKTLAKITSEAT
jgi:anthranilate phosphoribosyltransferase